MTFYIFPSTNIRFNTTGNTSSYSVSSRPALYQVSPPNLKPPLPPPHNTHPSRRYHLSKSHPWTLHLHHQQGMLFSKHHQAFIQALLSTAVFPQRFGFFTVCLLQWLWVAPMVDTEKKVFWILGLQIAWKCIFLGLSWNFRVLWGILKKSWLSRNMQLSFMFVCKYLNQRVRRIVE